ncbi:hypothetical protein Tco_0244192, partial [Tanacetum coccineum]
MGLSYQVEVKVDSQLEDPLTFGSGDQDFTSTINKKNGGDGSVGDKGE